MRTNTDDIYDCPDCDNERAVEYTREDNMVTLGPSGEIVDIETIGTLDIQEVWCPDCEQKIFDAEEAEA